jgi:Mor family transcriptional regulator
MSARRSQLRVEHLMVLLGPEAAVRLCQLYGGQQLPSRDQLARCLRRQAVYADRMNRGYSVPALAAKYGLSRQGVNKILAEHLVESRAGARLIEQLERGGR